MNFTTADEAQGREPDSSNVPDYIAPDLPVRDDVAAKQSLNLRASGISHLAAVVESSDDAIITKTLSGIIVTWNRAAERMFGYAADEVIGRSIAMLMPADHVEEEAALLARLQCGERIEHYETVRQHRSGSRIDVSLSISPIKDASGAIVGASKIARDITRQKRVEAALRASDQRFRLMANSAPALIWMADTTQAFTWCNHTWLAFTGRTLEQELGSGWTRDIHPADLDACLLRYRECFRTREPFRMEMRMRRHDGEWRWMVNTAVPLFEDEGQTFSGYIGNILDITDLRQAASEREGLLEAERAARSEAERLGRMKDEFLATLSHELRTPLNAVLGWTVLLRRLQPGSPDHEKGLETIERNARAQAKIIEDLLDMSRIISGKVQLDVKPFNLQEVVQGAVDAIRPSAEAKGLRLDTAFGSSVGLVRGDATRLQQVLWNLLTNAVKFTPAGGYIHVALEAVGTSVEISVRDSGMGILPEFQAFAFDRFRQADASITRGHGGLGLGLAIVKQLVELHGGTVRVSSEGEGKGSCFVVSLPAHAAHGERRERPDGAGAGGVAGPPELPSLEGITILVVDDEADAREMIGHLIVNRRGHVMLAGSAEQALEILGNQRIDVLVSDIGMPGTDGYELMRKVRSQAGAAAGTPAIAVTAFARAADRQRALLAGFQMHLPKPVEPRELIAGIWSLANLPR